MENAFLFKQIKKGLHTALKDMWVNESCWGDNLNGEGNDYFAIEEQDFSEFDWDNFVDTTNSIDEFSHKIPMVRNYLS